MHDFPVGLGGGRIHRNKFSTLMVRQLTIYSENTHSYSEGDGLVIIRVTPTNRESQSSPRILKMDGVGLELRAGSGARD